MVLQVKEISIDYTNCATDAPEVDFDVATGDGKDLAGLLEEIPSNKISRSFKATDLGDPPTWGRSTGEFKYPNGNTNPDAVLCIVDFEIPEDLEPPVLFYYRLTNFYQNHRRYVKSMDVNQLFGKAQTADQIKSGECDPLEVEKVGDVEKPYYPCGLIANSMFNDTFDPVKVLNKRSDDDSDTYEMTNKGIAWESDKDLYKMTDYKPEDVVPPPNWRTEFPSYNDSLPDIGQWEEFQVWMRTAGLPTFSKLARRNDNDIMKAGRYRIPIWSSKCQNGCGYTVAIIRLALFGSPLT